MTNSNLRLLSAIAILGTSSLSIGCVMHARASATAEADAPVVYGSRPTLVAVGSGVWVVRASARATYYVNDSYWCYRDGIWYRSSDYSGGWAVVQVSAVPTVIVKYDHTVYVNYQGSATAQTKPAPGNDYVASNDPPPAKYKDKYKDKDKDGLPGVGNNRKAEGEQPGQVGKGLLKDKDKCDSSPKFDKKADKGDHDDKKGGGGNNGNGNGKGGGKKK